MMRLDAGVRHHWTLWQANNAQKNNSFFQTQLSARVRAEGTRASLLDRETLRHPVGSPGL